MKTSTAQIFAEKQIIERIMEMTGWQMFLTAWALFFVASFVIRTIVWRKLLRLTSAARKLANEGQALIDKHGNTIGDLKKAGVYDQLQELETESGRLYRAAVPLAADLCWPPLLLWIKKPFMIWAYNRVSYFKGREGAQEAWKDVRKGYASNTNYYFPKHMLGLLASLRTATPFF